jgi:ADP-ribose pyrophosphatase YjhB (NUDIX family)
MKPSDHFHHCPRCGLKQPGPPDGSVFTCAECQFTLHFSAANAAAVFVERDDGRVLLIRRAKDPGRGLLAPAGGFIDIGETAEIAVGREVREEVGLELDDVRFVCSQPNSYLFKDVTYPVLDLFFTARAIDADRAQALEDVDSLCWLEPERVDPEDLAFPSMKAAFAVWLLGRASGKQENRKTGEPENKKIRK